MEKKWLSKAECDFCREQGIDPTIKGKKFYDAATIYGCWAGMCLNHFRQFSKYKVSELGMGRGQEYTRNENGEFIKTRG